MTTESGDLVDSWPRFVEMVKNFRSLATCLEQLRFARLSCISMVPGE